MTQTEAVDTVVKYWAGCTDAFGLVMALEAIGAIKFEPPTREELLERAKQYSKPGAALELSTKSIVKAAQLISDMAAELERA